MALKALSGSLVCESIANQFCPILKLGELFGSLPKCLATTWAAALDDGFESSPDGTLAATPYIFGRGSGQATTIDNEGRVVNVRADEARLWKMRRSETQFTPHRAWGYYPAVHSRETDQADSIGGTTAIKVTATSTANIALIASGAWGVLTDHPVGATMRITYEVFIPSSFTDAATFFFLDGDILASTGKTMSAADLPRDRWFRFSPPTPGQVRFIANIVNPGVVVNNHAAGDYFYMMPTQIEDVSGLANNMPSDRLFPHMHPIYNDPEFNRDLTGPWANDSWNCTGVGVDITGGQCVYTSVGSLVGITPVEFGARYHISYKVGAGVTLAFAAIGGVSLPTISGTHDVHVTAASTAPITFVGNVGATLDFVFVTKVESGSNVGGVKYSKFENGNTLDAHGFVTDGTGAAIEVGGYLSEAGKTNECQASDNTSAGGWAFMNGGTRVGGYPTARGLNTGATKDLNQGFLINDDNPAATTVLYYDTPAVITETKNMIVSWFLKKGTSSMSTLRVRAVASAINIADIDIDWSTTPPTATLVAGAGIATVSGPYYNDFYRIGVSVNWAAYSGTDTLRASLWPADQSSAANLGSVYFSGLQIEHGDDVAAPWPTTFIPTLISAVTRPADSLEYDGINYTEPAGWISAEVYIDDAFRTRYPVYGMMYSFQDAAGGQYNEFYAQSALQAVIELDRVTAANFPLQTADGYNVDGWKKIAVTWDAAGGEIGAAFNGTAEPRLTGVGSAIPDAISDFFVGCYGLSGTPTGHSNGRIRNMAMGNDTLTDAQLQDLTQ